MNRKLLQLFAGCSNVGRHVVTRNATIGSKIMQQKDDKSLIESDAKKLCEHVCVNYFIEGEEPGPKILPDSEYPEWLFKLRIDWPRELEDLDPERDGWIYWRTYRKRQIQQRNREEDLTIKRIHLQRNQELMRPKRYHK